MKVFYAHPKEGIEQQITQPRKKSLARIPENDVA